MNKQDTLIADLMVIVNRKKEAVEAQKEATKASWKTKCVVCINGTTHNVQTLNLETLMQVTASLFIQEEAQAKACKLFGIEDSLSYNGSSFEDWFADLKKRHALITLRTEEDKLKKMEARLADLVSPERKRELELEAIAKELEA